MFHILTVLDDASRATLASLIVLTPDLCAAVRAFRLAAERWGLPARVYADRASIFDSHAFRGGLADLGAHRIWVKSRNPLDIAQLRLDDATHLDRLRRTLAHHTPRLLVLDPFVRLVTGLDENSARDVSAVLGALRTLQREHDVAILLVHHMRKSPAAHPAQQLRGSGDFSAWADSALYLTRHDDERQLVVEHRGAPAPPPFRLRLVPGETPHLTLQDAQAPEASVAPGDPLQARVIEHLRAGPRPQPAQQLRDALHVRKADLLEALRCLADRGLVSKTEHGWTLATAAAAP